MSQPPKLIVIAAAVLFGSVAAWTGSAIVASCLEAMQLRSAAVVDASILNIDRQTPAAGDGTTELVFVTYSYDFEGRRFESRTRRLTLFGDSSGLHPQLEEAMRANKPVPCYVSRGNPSLSVFSRDVSIPLLLISLIFPLAFGSVSMICMWSLLRNRRRLAIRQTNV